MFTWLRDALNTILCWIQAIANMVLWALATVFNAIIAAIAAAIAAAISLLPDMPDPPDWSGIATDVFGYANWAFPVGVLVATIATLAILLLAWKAVEVLLRIGKAVP